MAEIRSPEAKQLCTATEFELFKNSLGTLLRKLTPAQLRTKISRTRKLRDKYRDLAHRQRREARGKQQPRGARASQGNERTVRKVDLFNQIMSRFADRLKTLESAAKKENKASTATRKKRTKRSSKKVATTAGSPSASSTKKKASKAEGEETAEQLKKPARSQKSKRSFMESLGGPPPRELKARAARRKEKSRTSTSPSRQDIRESAASKKIKGHVSASTKRAQGRRDAK